MIQIEEITVGCFVKWTHPPYAGEAAYNIGGQVEAIEEDNLVCVVTAPFPRMYGILPHKLTVVSAEVATKDPAFVVQTDDAATLRLKAAFKAVELKGCSSDD